MIEGGRVRKSRAKRGMQRGNCFKIVANENFVSLLKPKGSYIIAEFKDSTIP